MELFASGRIVLAVAPVDWRYGIRGLTSEAEMTLGLTELTEQDVWVVFRNRRGDALRVLHYTPETVELYEQRLRHGGAYAQLLDEVQKGTEVSLTRDELRLLLERRVGPLRLGSARRSRGGTVPTSTAAADPAA